MIKSDNFFYEKWKLFLVFLLILMAILFGYFLTTKKDLDNPKNNIIENTTVKEDDNFIGISKEEAEEIYYKYWNYFDNTKKEEFVLKNINGYPIKNVSQEDKEKVITGIVKDAPLEPTYKMISKEDLEKEFHKYFLNEIKVNYQNEYNLLGLADTRYFIYNDALSAYVIYNCPACGGTGLALIEEMIIFAERKNNEVTIKVSSLDKIYEYAYEFRAEDGIQKLISKKIINN